MLNYIWAGLIVFSLVFALVNDTLDLSRDTYANGRSLDVTIVETSKTSPRPVTVRISQDTYRKFYNADELKIDAYAATLIEAPQGRELRFAADAPLPPRLAKIRDLTASEDKQLRAVLTNYDPGADHLNAALRFPAVRWVSMQAISNA